MRGWCRRDALARSFCSRLDASSSDAFEPCERHHAKASAAGAKLSVGEAHRPAAMSGERFQIGTDAARHLEPLDLLG